MKKIELLSPAGNLDIFKSVIGAGADVLRFVPPLIIEKEHVDEMIRILKKVL